MWHETWELYTIRTVHCCCAAGTANLRFTAGLHTSRRGNNINTFLTPVDTAASWRADLLSHRAFSACVWASASFKRTLWTTYVWWMWEKVWTTCTQTNPSVQKGLSCKLKCARYVVHTQLTSPTYWKRLSVRWVPSNPLTCVHRALFSFTSELFSSCRRLGNSHKPASNPVRTQAV